MSYVEQQIQNQLESSMNEYKEMNKQIQQLQEENKLLRECVEFYADENNWQDCWIDGCAGSEDYFTNIINDMGNRLGGFKARKTLAKIKGDE